MLNHITTSSIHNTRLTSGYALIDGLGCQACLLALQSPLIRHPHFKCGRGGNSLQKYQTAYNQTFSIASIRLPETAFQIK
jgi:hypothetical protein